MANTWFQFRQFTVHQQQAAMKVSTDACLFGAWIARHAGKTSRVLDIGTGTGLLSLMYAQQHPEAIIDAVEIDKAAAQQARENFSASPWSKRLTVYETPVQQYTAGLPYDLILSNPPFFENDLRSPVAGRNKARHDSSLTLEAFRTIAPSQLSPSGKLAVLLPHHRAGYFMQLMNGVGLYPMAGLQVKPAPRHSYFRSLLCFSKEQHNYTEQTMTIRESDNSYSDNFTELLKEYYLYLA